MSATLRVAGDEWIPDQRSGHSGSFQLQVKDMKSKGLRDTKSAYPSHRFTCDLNVHLPGPSRNSAEHYAQSWSDAFVVSSITPHEPSAKAAGAQYVCLNSTSQPLQAPYQK